MRHIVQPCPPIETYCKILSIQNCVGLSGCFQLNFRCNNMQFEQLILPVRGNTENVSSPSFAILLCFFSLHKTILECSNLRERKKQIVTFYLKCSVQAFKVLMNIWHRFLFIGCYFRMHFLNNFITYI